VIKSHRSFIVLIAKPTVHDKLALLKHLNWKKIARTNLHVTLNQQRYHLKSSLKEKQVTVNAKTD